MNIIKKIILLSLATLFFYQIDARVRLIGLYNNLSKGNVTFESDSSKETKGRPTKWPQPVYLPQTLTIKLPNKDAFKIKIEENTDLSSCSRDQFEVTADVTTWTGAGKTKSICLTNASTSIINKDPNQFRNVLFVIADNPGAAANELPFKFGLSAWSSSKGDWYKPTITSPIDNKSIVFSEPLRVLQGYSGFGGGENPRMTLAHIQDMYNATMDTILINRNTTLGNNFENLIPPFSAVPFASTWIPKVHPLKFDDPQKNAIRIFALRPPASTKLSVDSLVFSITNPSEASEVKQKAENVYQELQKIINPSKTTLAQQETTDETPQEKTDKKEEPQTVTSLIKKTIDESKGRIRQDTITPFSRGQYELPFENAAFRLVHPGDISEVIQTSKGFEILILKEKQLQSTAKPQNFELITKSGTKELVGEARDVDEIISNMQKSVPDFVSAITGQPDLSEMMEHNQFYIGKYSYNIFTNALTNKVIIQRCDLKGENGVIVSESSVPATTQAGYPNYFKLIIKTDDTYGVSLDLSQTPEATPF